VLWSIFGALVWISWLSAQVDSDGLFAIVMPVKTYNRGLVARAREMRHDMTPAELHLWLHFLKDHQPRVRRQRPFGRFIVDFYCSEYKVVIEIDGANHFTEQGLAHDAERSAFLEAAGLRIVRFKNNDVLRNLEAVCLQLKEILCDK
jgi:very-short-patch-repair endonuclease